MSPAGHVMLELLHLSFSASYPLPAPPWGEAAGQVQLTNEGLTVGPPRVVLCHSVSDYSMAIVVYSVLF